MQKATRQQLKSHNSRLILKMIYDRHAVSRTDIARATRLSKATVSDVVAGLLADGLVAEIGTGVSAGGKPPTLLGIVDDARTLIGVDLAEEQLLGMVTDLRGRILYQSSIDIGLLDGEAALAMVYTLLDDLVAAAPDTLLGIGLGTPGLVDSRTGVVLRAVNRNWRDLPLVELIQNRYDRPVYIANDGHAAALGEYVFGRDRQAESAEAEQHAAPSTTNLVVLKVGTGVSAGIVLAGRLFGGDGHGAGELGHVALPGATGRCRCGNVGCLETEINLRALLQRAQQIAEMHPASALARQRGDQARVTYDMLLAACDDPDVHCRDLIAQEARFLAFAVAMLVNVLNVERIVIAGTVAQLGAPLLTAVKAELPTQGLTPLVERTEVVLASLGSDIVAYGAAALLLSSELGLV